MDIQSFKIFINELADMSGAYIAKHFGERIKVDFKKDNSPVTAIDKNTEAMLREAISKKFPGHGIIGEEYGICNDEAEFVWVLDPIDGTKSFISGVPLFGTLIGLMRNRAPILGVIDQPVLGQRIMGDNEVCLYNGQPVKSSARTDIDGITLLTSDSREAAKLRDADGWRSLEDRAAISRTWGDCYGYMLLCRGFAHVMCDAVLEIWDQCALLPALKGAGAVYSDWYGGDKIGPDGLVASCNAEMHRLVLVELNQTGKAGV